MTTKTQERIEKGCLYQETYSKNSFCKKGNLCSECSLQLKVLQEQEFELREEFEEVINDMDLELIFTDVKKDNKEIPESEVIMEFVEIIWRHIKERLLSKLKNHSPQRIKVNPASDTDSEIRKRANDTKIEDSLRGNGLCKCGHGFTNHMESTTKVSKGCIKCKCNCSKFVEVRE